MGARNPPDERVVYVALKNVFKGQNAAVRQPKAIRKLIVDHREEVGVAALVNAHGLDTICKTARNLLAGEIFKSTPKANVRFPEVLEVSPAQSAKRTEAEAARNDANAIQDAAEEHQVVVQDVLQFFGNVEVGRGKTWQESETPTIKDSRHVPSLFPVYLPLRTQHCLLVKVQELLERTCFLFGQRVMPDILRDEEWECAEAVELNVWAGVFRQRQDRFGKTNDVGKPLDMLFHSVAEIRHAAVHRTRVSASGIEQFILDAESLARLLEDPLGLKALTALRRDVVWATEELERNKHSLDSKLVDTLHKIAIDRAELDRLEKAATADMVEKDHEYQVLAGTNLEQAILSLEASTMTAGNATGSDSDDTDSFVSCEETDSEIDQTQWPRY